MKILITAGGTTEKIDEVRSISNNSTGMLGKAIAEAFSFLEETEKIYYLCGLGAALPDTPKAEIIRIGSVAELENKVRKVLSTGHVDVVIHCMAVSDYRVESVTTSNLIAEKILGSVRTGGVSEESDEILREELANAVKSAETLSNKSKISSDMDDLVLILKKTPKIISLFKKLAPEAVLVGFKLLNGVSYDTLIETGRGVLEKNKCDFVLANDLKEITSDRHIGYLIDSSGHVERMTCKREIAEQIVRSVIDKRMRTK